MDGKDDGASDAVGIRLKVGISDGDGEGNWLGIGDGGRDGAPVVGDEVWPCTGTIGIFTNHATATTTKEEDHTRLLLLLL